LGKANLVADIRSRAGLVSFAIIFFLDSISPQDRTRRFTPLDYGSIFIGWCVVCLKSCSRVDSAIRATSISSLTRASTGRSNSWDSFLCTPAQCHESKGAAGQFGTGLAVSELSTSYVRCGPDRATSKSYGHALHKRTDTYDSWHICTIFEHEHVRTPNGPRISKIKMTRNFQDGNPKLLGETFALATKS
jgi:hypothetical protein